MNLLAFSVAGPSDAVLVQQNADNLIKLNPALNIEFVIINNTGKVIIPEISFSSKIRIIDGLPNNSQYPPSIHHSMAINSFLASIDESMWDYFLLLDPDFIQLKPDVITQIILTMRDERANVYSFPWHPRWYSKFRSRTSPHFFLFDRHLLDQKLLNFSPALTEITIFHFILNLLNNIKHLFDNKIQSGISRKLSAPNDRTISKFKKLLKVITSFLISRLALNSSKDTGYRNSLKFLSSYGIKLIVGKMLVSSFSVSNIYHLRFKYFRLFEMHIIPNAISYLPLLDEYVYTDSYAHIEATTNIEIMSLDGTSPCFAHLRKFTRESTIPDVKSIKDLFLN